jgi:D-alanyl-D-alanine dipeptidase
MNVRWDRTKGCPEPMSALDRVRLEENGEPLVKISEVAPSALIIRDTVIPYLRERPAKMLEKAARKLMPKYRIGVVDAWRPIERQKRIYEWFMKCAEEAFPKRTLPALRRTVNRMVHAYDRKAPPGHCTGGAVDVWLCDPQGKVLDVSAPFGRFWASRTYSLGLDNGAIKHRMTLVNAMLGAGFSNCRDEWWHYSFGDAAWAVRTGSAVCYYGLMQLDPKLYKERERKWLKRFKKRTNPFLMKEEE